MPTKYLILFLSLILSGCLTNNPGQVTIVEKSFNKVLNDNQVASNNKNWSLPVDAEILKKFSIENNHPGLTYIMYLVKMSELSEREKWSIAETK